MAESDFILNLLLNADSNPQVNQIIEEVNRFNSYTESMGFSTKKKEILRSREEMKFETVSSNLNNDFAYERNYTNRRILYKNATENDGKE